MTVRGGGVPRKPWLSCRCAEWARRLGASLPMRKTASWSGSFRPTEYKVAARLFVRHKRAPLDIVIPTTTSVLPCSELSRCGLASPGHEEKSERRHRYDESERCSRRERKSPRSGRHSRHLDLTVAPLVAIRARRCSSTDAPGSLLPF